LSNVDPGVRGIATQLKPLQRAGQRGLDDVPAVRRGRHTAGLELQVGHVMTPDPLSVQLQELVPLVVAGSAVLGSVSGVLPSIIRSIEPGVVDEQQHVRQRRVGVGLLGLARPRGRDQRHGRRRGGERPRQHWASVLIVDSSSPRALDRSGDDARSLDLDPLVRVRPRRLSGDDGLRDAARGRGHLDEAEVKIGRVARRSLGLRRAP
jgi:hypothetical protein